MSFSILGVDGKILPVIVYDVNKRIKRAAGFGSILFRERWEHREFGKIEQDIGHMPLKVVCSNIGLFT